MPQLLLPLKRCGHSQHIRLRRRRCMAKRPRPEKQPKPTKLLRKTWRISRYSHARHTRCVRHLRPDNQARRFRRRWRTLQCQEGARPFPPGPCPVPDLDKFSRDLASRCRQELGMRQEPLRRWRFPRPFAPRGFPVLRARIRLPESRPPFQVSPLLGRSHGPVRPPQHCRRRRIRSGEEVRCVHLLSRIWRDSPPLVPSFHPERIWSRASLNPRRALRPCRDPGCRPTVLRAPCRDGPSTLAPFDPVSP